MRGPQLLNKDNFGAALDGNRMSEIISDSDLYDESAARMSDTSNTTLGNQFKALATTSPNVEVKKSPFQNVGNNTPQNENPLDEITQNDDSFWLLYLQIS